MVVCRCRKVSAFPTLVLGIVCNAGSNELRDEGCLVLRLFLSAIVYVEKLK